MRGLVDDSSLFWRKIIVSVYFLQDSRLRCIKTEKNPARRAHRRVSGELGRRPGPRANSVFVLRSRTGRGRPMIGRVLNPGLTADCVAAADGKDLEPFGFVKRRKRRRERRPRRPHALYGIGMVSRRGAETRRFGSSPGLVTTDGSRIPR
jgi:hypothetical protein